MVYGPISQKMERKVKAVKFAGYTIRVPRHPLVRLLFGLMLVVLGLLGFLPILGFWMVPLGLIILSIDIAFIRRKRRAWSVKLGVWLMRRWPAVAKSMGYGPIRSEKL